MELLHSGEYSGSDPGGSSRRDIIEEVDFFSKSRLRDEAAGLQPEIPNSSPPPPPPGEPSINVSTLSCILFSLSLSIYLCLNEKKKILNLNHHHDYDHHILII